MNIIIPIGGYGSRFLDDDYSLPKPLIKSLGKPIIFWNIENLNISNDDVLYIIYRDEFKVFNFEDLLVNKFRNINFKFISISNDTRGSSETVLYALREMGDVELDNLTLIVDSDNFYTDDIVSISKKQNSNLIFYKKDYDEAPLYSYIEVNSIGEVINIREKEKISDNACVGAYCFNSARLLKDTIIKTISEDIRQKNEFYISNLYLTMIQTDIIVNSKEIHGNVCLGTPQQLKSFSSNMAQVDEKYRFCFDMDNTLVSYPQIVGDYTTVKPIQSTINFLNHIKSLGHTVIIYTARRMKTHSGNIGKVQADIARITLDTLDKYNIQYDELHFGKPYAHFYIDDLSIKPWENLEKETGFYNIHPNTRSHNKIEVYDNYIIKYSNKIDGEKYFYKNVPESVKQYFPVMIDSDVNFVKIEKIKGIPVSFLNVNNTLTIKTLKLILTTLHSIHSSESPKYDVNIYSNYSEKINERIQNYDFSSYPNFEETVSDILDFLKKYEEEILGKIGVIHGDAVFTNILIDVKDNIKLIDMRGKVGDLLTIYGDIFYDYAKIYQSLIGYDHILMGKSIDNINQENIVFFEKYILDNFDESTLFNIKQLTKSLIISLIPIHNNDKCLEYYSLIKKIK